MTFNDKNTPDQLFASVTVVKLLQLLVSVIVCISMLILVKTLDKMCVTCHCLHFFHL